MITIPGAVGGAQATGINNSRRHCGFFIDANGVNHGWLLNRGVFMPLDFPGSTVTQALGLNNRGQGRRLLHGCRRPDPRLRLHDRHRQVRDGR